MEIWVCCWVCKWPHCEEIENGWIYIHTVEEVTARGIRVIDITLNFTNSILY